MVRRMSLLHGKCHCGSFQFDVYDVNLDAVTSCNCNLCRKQGCLWVIPASIQITGDDETLIYSDSTESAASLPLKGSCHCGRIKIELLEPMEHFDMTADNCSICARNGWVGIYPPQQQVRLTGSEHMQEYRFGRRYNCGPFCRNCGVQVCQIPHGPPQHEVDAMPEGLKAVISEKLNLKPLNVRVFDDINMETLNIKRSNEGTEGYEMNVLDLQSAMSIEMSE